MCEWCTEMKATRSCTYPNDGGSGWTVVRGCRVHRLIARRARRLGSRRASHLVDVERKRSCTGSVHSSCSFCTKLKAWTPRTPPSWLAAGAAGRMPAVRRPAMHHSSLCAGAYLKGHRETRLGGGRSVWGKIEGREENGERKGFLFFPPRALTESGSHSIKNWCSVRIGVRFGSDTTGAHGRD